MLWCASWSPCRVPSQQSLNFYRWSWYFKKPKFISMSCNIKLDLIHCAGCGWLHCLLVRSLQIHRSFLCGVVWEVPQPGLCESRCWWIECKSFFFIVVKEHWSPLRGGQSSHFNGGLQDISTQFEVRAMPTFLFIENGAAIDKLVGANKGELENKVKLYDSKCASHAA